MRKKERLRIWSEEAQLESPGQFTFACATTRCASKHVRFSPLPTHGSIGQRTMTLSGEMSLCKTDSP